MVLNSHSYPAKNLTGRYSKREQVDVEQTGKCTTDGTYPFEKREVHTFHNELY
jgi:hypothetical protein